MAPVLRTIAEAEKEVASFAAVGLASADSEQVKALAQSLRDAGLESPAREADKLAALVGPAGARDEQLNAFARLHQMLEIVRVKVAGIEDFSSTELVDVPPLPSLKVEKAMLGSEAGPLEYRADSGQAGRYAYLARAYRWLDERPLVEPDHEGLTIWGDLTLGPILGMRFEGKPDEALAAAGKALAMWNVAVRRNAVRVLEKAFAPLAPLAKDHPAMDLLRSAWGDARPIVMYEAIAAWRRLLGLPPYDLTAHFESFPAEARAGVVAEAETLSIYKRREILGTRTSSMREERRFWALHASEWTPYEWAFYWQVQFMKSRQLYGHGGKLTSGALGSPRGEALESMKQCFAGGKPADQEEWLEFLWYVEDPLAGRLVRPLLYSQKDSVRRHAIVAAGILGDPSVISVAEIAILEKNKDSPWAVWALGFLGDVRAFHFLWRAFESGVKDDAVLEVLPMFGELAAPVLDKLAADPKAATPTQLRILLLRLYPGRELDALLYAADRAPDPKVEAQLLRPFSITKKRLEEWKAHEESLARTGFFRSPDGFWLRDPRAAEPQDPGLLAMQRGLPSHVWMEKENERRRQATILLSADSDLDDWTEALFRRFYDEIHARERPDEDRAKALRRLAIVGGEDSERRLTWALAALQPGEADRLSGLAFPKRKAKGAKPA